MVAARPHDAARPRLKGRLTRLWPFGSLTTISSTREELQLGQLIEQRLGFLQIKRIESLGEPPKTRMAKN